MMKTAKQWGWAINSSGLGLYLVGLAFLVGLSSVVDRGQEDRQGTPVLAWRDYDQPVQEGRSDLMQGEQGALAARVSNGAPWTSHLQGVDEALAQKDVSAAEQAWHQAYVEAIRSRRWEGFVAVGDASLRIGEVVGARPAPVAKARRLYLAALLRAREQGSLDGALRAAEAFAALGDREIAGQGLRIADGLAARRDDAQAHARVRAFADRLAAGALEASRSASDPF